MQLRHILSDSFFCRDTRIVARELLGKFLVRRIGKEEIALMITETEAYDGPHDKASHAHRGETPRNEVMFREAGFWYVYLVYGVYHMLNIVTGERGYPAAVLIRGAGEYDGPGKLTKALRINRQQNGKKARRSSGLWIEDRGVVIPKLGIQKAPRIGVAYAEEWAKKPYRFLLRAGE
ncbi:MAG: DNA-3-methyladenine glycosylase [Candidatus Lloydbacteria bacterium]|nr:DNA-3-methyladenine glycosylase [Candidatus Lloydbacteria bacterium]